MRTAVYAQSFVLGVAIAVSAYAGDLNPPPGPIGPTMKNLEEVEPRIPLFPEIPEIPDAVYLIDQPGSYYLPGNALGVSGKNGILITASDVAIDLMGFTLNGVAGSLHGIATPMLPVSVSNISIRNGTIRDWGGNGIMASNSSHGRPDRVIVKYNGGDGIVLGENGTCENCTAQANTGRGIVADKSSPQLFKVSAIGNGGDGIVLGENATCNDCTAQGNAGRGIVADKAIPKEQRALAIGNGGDGIVLGENGTCENCTASGNAGRGIVADKSSPKLFKCSAIGNTGGDGIVLGENGTCENCTAQGNSGRGIVADKSSPKLFKCSAIGNTGGDGIVLGDGGTGVNCMSRNNGGIGIMCPYVASWNGAESVGNMLDGFVVGPGSTLTDCQALNNGGNGVRVTDNNVPAKTDTVVLRGCIARGNGAIGFKMTQPPVTQVSAGVIDGPASAPAARQSVAQGNGSDRFSVGSGSVLEGRMAGDNRGNRIGLAIPYDWGLSLFACIAEGNASDGFSVGGGSMQNCIARNNGGVGINSMSRGVGRGTTAEGNGLDGFIVTSGAMLTGCTAQGNGTTGVGSGIRVTGTGNRLEGNHLLSNYDWGLSLFGGGNLVIGNTAADNRIADYDIAAGNSYGPIVSAAAGNLSMASGGDQPTANFSLTCPTWCQDADTDTFGNPNSTTRSCTQPSGYVTDCTDCDDTNASIHPGATEVCNGVDDDCDQTIDEGCPPP